MQSVAEDSKSGQALQRLREFGYAFNEAGQLRKIDEVSGALTEQPFIFEISASHSENQAHYEQLAEQIPEIVYDLLEQAGLQRNYIPAHLPTSEASFFFSRPAKLQHSKKLLVLIHGSGFVRAGQWARSLIINNSLQHGTQLPYIERAKELGYDIVVLNTNDTHRNGKPIPEVASATQHAQHVWQQYIVPSQPQAVAIVAHSAGGAVTLDLLNKYTDFFKKHVFGIALTDSAHFGVPDRVKSLVADIACNWVASDKLVGTEIKTSKSDVPRVSAGHTKHEWTSYAAFESVFRYLEDNYDKFTNLQSSKKARLD